MSKTPSLSCSARTQASIHVVGTVVALALALVSLLPGLAAAKIAGNHNQTLLR